MYAGYFFVFCFLHETYDADDTWIDKRKRRTIEEENEQTANEKNWLQPTHTHTEKKKEKKERDRDEKERKVDIDKRIKI